MNAALVHEVRDFATPEECWTVITAYERCRASAGFAVGDPFFDYRVLWVGSFPDSENATRRILQDWRRRATITVSSYAKQRLFSDTIQVVRWDGQEMPPHYDDRHPDGSPHRSPWRAWAGVLYLNDDYGGGEIWFPATGTVHKPVAGSFIFFEGALLHGVRKTTHGLRYTSPSWYTTDPAREDAWAHVPY